MATVTETQAYLDEAKNPSVIDAAALVIALRAFAPTAGDVIQQSGRLARLLQDSELIEADAQLVGKYEEIFQKFQAMRRVAGEIERSTRALINTWRDWSKLDAELRVRASELGYMV